MSSRSRMEVSDIKVRFVEDSVDGLLAWASCIIDGSIYLNNIAVRRGRDGGLMLTYPAKRTAGGSRFYYFNPISAKAAKVVEDAVLARLAKLARIAASENEEN